ncbi:hypothetical protein HELRODRAFT_65942, partial [Helobdella robusta]|uniref:PNT domain-containing protein n=1 Tax=Helobdella robusta TaxID=6412 RepID=T1FYE7_HELRO
SDTPIKSSTNRKFSQTLVDLFKSFKLHQVRWGIPKDPRNWSSKQVLQWICWASDTFHFEGVDRSKFNQSGRDLINRSRDAFIKLAPPNVTDVLWKHLEFLKRGWSCSIGKVIFTCYK